MANVTLTKVFKYYPGSQKPAVKDFNLEINDKEFVVFVGPSGCGKSTTLRMVAGLEEISEGEIYIDGKIVNDVEPKDRDIAMVFQNYALYPHMTVYDNMAFGIRLKKIPYTVKVIDKKQIRILNKELKTLTKQYKKEQNEETANLINEINQKIEELKANPIEITKYRKYTNAEIDDKVLEASKTLEIEEFLERKPKALSGGQRQRVAIGRAIVRNPKVFLMDEPLSNLDAKLRNQMRAELILLRKKINTTFIYVTHDQVEAMTLGDRIVVMKDGVVQQVGTPVEVFQNPSNIFVAGFIGTPQMNFMDVDLTKDGNTYYVSYLDKKIKLSEKVSESLLNNNVESRKVTLGVRPDHFVLGKKQHETFVGKLVVSEMMGTEYHLHVQVGDKKIAIKTPITNLTTDDLAMIARQDDVEFGIDNNYMYIFDVETGENLAK